MRLSFENTCTPKELIKCIRGRGMPGSVASDGADGHKETENLIISKLVRGATLRLDTKSKYFLKRVSQRARARRQLLCRSKRKVLRTCQLL